MIVRKGGSFVRFYQEWARKITKMVKANVFINLYSQWRVLNSGGTFWYCFNFGFPTSVVLGEVVLLSPLLFSFFNLTPIEDPETISGSISMAKLWSTSNPFPFFKGCDLCAIAKKRMRLLRNMLKLLRAIEFLASN